MRFKKSTVSDLTTSLNGLTITANNTSATYVWLDCDDNNNPIPNETNQSFTASSNGNYAVQLTENGCVDTSYCVAITTVGIQENSFADDFTFYPNPTNGIISVDFQNVHEYLSVKILTSSGQIVESKEFRNVNSVELEVTEPIGVYLLEIIDEKQNKIVLRVIKQ